MASLRSIKAALFRTQSARDKKQFDYLVGPEERRHLQAQLDDLIARNASGGVDNETFDRERRALLGSIAHTEFLLSHHFSWRRMAAGGLADGALAALLALDVWVWSRPGQALTALALLTALAAALWVRGSYANKQHAGPATKGPRAWLSAGPGFYAVASALIAATWASPAMRLFTDTLIGLGAVYWLFCALAWPFASWRFATGVKKAYRDADKWHTENGASAKNASSKARLMRMRAFGGVAAERVARLSIVVSLIAVGPWVGNFVAAHAGPSALHASDASAFTAVAPEAGKRVADAVQRNAAAALSLAQRANAAPTPDWLGPEALKAPLPEGAGAGWSSALPDGWRVAPSLTAYYRGVWRPAGLWVFRNRRKDLSERAVLSSGVFFVPFLQDDKCRALGKDLAARDADWRRRQLSAAAGDQGQQKLLDEFARKVPSEPQTIACVGEPIAMKSNAEVRDRASDELVYRRDALLNDLGDWSDFQSWMGMRRPLGRAIYFKFFKMGNSVLNYLLWK